MTRGGRWLAAALLLLGPVAAFGGPSGPTAISFSPASPKPGDTVTATISGMADGCRPKMATVSVNGSTIVIDTSFVPIPCNSACLLLFGPYTFTVTFTAPSKDGVYNVEYYFTSCPAQRDLISTQQLVVAGTCDIGHSLIADHASVRVGDAVTLSWCDPAYSLTDSGYYVNAYRIYSSRSAAGPFTVTADVQGHATTSAQVHPDTGTTYYYVESHGCLGVITMCGTGATDTTMLSNIVAVSAAAPDACLPSATTLCVGKGRFQITARWQTADGRNGDGRAVQLTSDSGTFWFFDSGNVEVTAKVLNACSFSPPAFWFFAAGMTNVQVDLTATDTKTGAVKRYANPLGTSFATVLDTNAFGCP